MSPRIIAELHHTNICQNDRLILEDINFSIAEAEFCYLIGKTGAGKSTFLKALYGALPISAGQGQVSSFDLLRLNMKTKPLMRRKLGMIFQNFLLFEEWSVKENLRYVLLATDWKIKSEIEQRIHEVLEFTNLAQYEHTLTAKLSGGEQQRLAIARAILNKPDLLIADEPTGNLDPDSSDAILYLLRELTYRHKMATIFATHDYRIIKKFPARVFTCENGSIHEA